MMTLRRLSIASLLWLVIACGGAPGAEAPAQAPAAGFQAGAGEGAPEPAYASEDSDEAAEEAAETPSSLKPGPEPPLRNLADAQAALERAREELDALYGNVPAADGRAEHEAAEPAAGAAPAGRPRPASAPAPRSAPAKKGESGPGRCERACQAFGSLERAAGAVCRLAGEKDRRCTRAKDVVGENGSRIAGCGCPPADAE